MYVCVHHICVSTPERRDFQRLDEHIELSLGACPIFESLRSGRLQPRHWQRLTQFSSASDDLDESGLVEVGALLAAQLPLHADELEQLFVCVREERIVEDRLTAVR